MRPTSRDLERTFNAWIDGIANRQLIFPKIPTTNKAENVNSKVKSDDSTTISTSGSINSYKSTPSQPLPSLSIAQHKLLEEQDERRKYKFFDYSNAIFLLMLKFPLWKGDALYQRYLDQRLLEHAEQESRNKDKGSFNLHVDATCLI